MSTSSLAEVVAARDVVGGCCPIDEWSSSMTHTATSKAFFRAATAEAISFLGWDEQANKQNLR
jgi:hypothetical protein